MNPSSCRKICEDTMNGESITTKSKCTPRSKSIPSDYETVIDQSDIHTFSRVENNMKIPCQNFNEELLTPIKKRNFCVSRRRSLATKKTGKSRLQTKKIAKACTQTCELAEIKKEPVFSSNTIQNIEDFVEKNKAKNLTHSRNSQKLSKIVENENSAHQKIENIYENEHFEKINKDVKSFISKNKASKIPRVKPHVFLSANKNSPAYPNMRLPVRNTSKPLINMKSVAVCNEEETVGNNLKKEVSYIINYQSNLKTMDNLPATEGNLTNHWHLEKSSEVDTDEEFETNESRIITGASGDTHSTAFLRSLTLKCTECRSCNNYKYTSSIHTGITGRHTETDSWSSSETNNTRNWHKKLIKHRKIRDRSSEDLDLISNYSAVNHRKIKIEENERNNKISKYADYFTKSSANNSTKIKTYRTANFSFFNTLFDIIFWPFVFVKTR